MQLALGIAALLLAVLLIGVLYQMLGGRRDRLRYTQDGRTISISNGSALFVREQGRGEPAVIFEAGIGATSLSWRHIQNAIAQTNATASYDRCGLGWSSRCRSARTPSNIVSDLHELLGRAAIPAPYILVGHSFGGQVMRRFALRYPAEVVGLVLVDPMRCEEWPPLNPAKQCEINRGRHLIRCGMPITHSGLARLVLTSVLPASDSVYRPVSSESPSTGKKGFGQVLSRLRSEVGKMPPSVRPVVASHWSRPAYYAGIRKHIDAIPDTVREMHSAEPIRNAPIIVITPGKSTPLSEDGLRAIGNQVQQVIAPVSGHWVNLDQPEIVIEAIRSLQAQASVGLLAAAD